MAVSIQKLREINLLPATDAKNEYCDNTVVTSKYTLITFLPKNLFEQFRRMVNFFFLCLIIIQVSIDIPVNPIPYAAAFIFVIGITGVKQGYEDWCRHRADNKVNFALSTLVDHSGKCIKIKSKDIHVGQLIKLEAEEPVPCDLLLIACESLAKVPQSFCQITTVNLDGESNLKMRFCPSGLESILETSNCGVVPDRLKSYFLRYDLPNSDLYFFNAQITSPKLVKPVNITMENVLLRGSRVKNCEAIYGIAIYTGKDSRLSMNSNKVKISKFSTIEHTMNKIVIGMFISLLLLSSISVVLSFLNRNNKFEKMWYLPTNDDSDFKHGVTIFFSYLVLLCYMIPVSLSVTFELQKLGCSKFFGWDDEMVCPDTGTRAICNTSDLNEELGLVEYLFTDKTGTLTDNDLIFRCCSINGIKYQYSADEVEAKLISSENNNELDKISHYNFLKALALSHTVRVLPGTGEDLKPVYQANSLDEEILVKAAYSLGVKFLGGEENNVKLDFLGSVQHFKILATLEFDSDRKCMSVLLQHDQDEQYFLFCKGAESSILPKCNGLQSIVDITASHVTDFANMGYRTLVIAYKTLEKSNVKSFLQKAEEFRSNPQELGKLYSEIESDLVLLGCTGVEDKLQSGVPETLCMLKEAGIKVFMITGDKLETAISIASSCKLINQESIQENSKQSTIFVIQSLEEDEDSIRKQLEKFQIASEKLSDMVLVIDGSSFGLALKNSKDLLRNIIINSNSVIFCRMAPLQKSQVVNLIKTNPKTQFKTCAVGDGGNDCAMLREAHLGIGIIGKEGLQAARESDFAVARFRFLQKALLVHGYWYYHRLATLITYFFYRGTVFIFQIFLYGFDSGFSAQTIFDSTFVMMFTISFTSVPVLIQGLTEQPISKEELLNYPKNYKTITRNNLMSFRQCLRWYLIGIWHILICHYVPKYIWMEASTIDDYGAFSLFISSVLVLITDTKVLVETRYFTSLTFLSQLFSYGTMVGFYMLLCHAISDGKGALAFSYIPMLQEIHVWLTLVLVGILSLIPDLIYSIIKENF